MLMLRRNGRAKAFFSSFILKNLSPFSSSSTNPTTKNPSLADFLIESFGFSDREAIAVSKKLSPSKPFKPSNLAVHLLKEYGLSDTQMREIVSAAPAFASSRLARTLGPKLRVFKELAFPAPDLVKLVKRNPVLFTRGLNTYITPSIRYVRELLGSDERVVRAINRSSWFLANNPLDKMPTNVSLLRKAGLSDEKIGKLVVQKPRLIVQKPEWLEDILKRVEDEFGISPDSGMFIHGILLLSSNNRSSMEKKFEIFRGFEWADAEIYAMARNQPASLRSSEGKLRSGLSFFMNEVRYTSAYLAAHPCFLMYSLERRVKPRHRVVELLRANELMGSRTCFYSITLMTEDQFLDKYVLRYKDDIPNLYETYVGSLKP